MSGFDGAIVMTGRSSLNIINPEAIETLVRELVSYLPSEQAPEYQALAIVALKPAIYSCSDLFKLVTELPDGSPAWLTPEKLARGTYHRFAPREDERSFRALERIDWLAMWLNAGFLGHVRIRTRALPASWFRGLRHIRDLEDAIARARHDLAAWVPRRQEAVPERWRDITWMVRHGALVARPIRPDSSLVWYELMTAEALVAEAMLMEHCLNRSSYRTELQAGRARFFSLRTPAGDPQLTLRVPKNGLWEAYRHRNRAPREQDTAAVKGLLDEIAQGMQSPTGATNALPYDADQRERELSFESFIWLLRSQDVELSRKAPVSEDEIEQLIASWLAGAGSDLMVLYDRLLDELSHSHDGEAGEPSDDDAESDAFHHVESAIRDMEPTPLNLRRVRNWCRNWTSSAGHEALLTKFWDLLDAAEQAQYLKEARETWIPEVVQDWLGERCV
jgi:hypothetical protein